MTCSSQAGEPTWRSGGGGVEGLEEHAADASPMAIAAHHEAERFTDGIWPPGASVAPTPWRARARSRGIWHQGLLDSRRRGAPRRGVGQRRKRERRHPVSGRLGPRRVPARTPLRRRRPMAKRASRGLWLLRVLALAGAS